MPQYDFRTPRLYLATALGPGAAPVLERTQANYLVNVLRLKPGDPVLVFNGRDGEWQAQLSGTAKRGVLLSVGERQRAQTTAMNLHYLFAPLKHARLDYMVQKAVEMGTSRLQPVITRHTQIARVNLERMQANAIEAAEQCGILTLPEIAPPQSLDQALAQRDPSRLLIFCDEAAEAKDPIAALAAAQPAASGPNAPLAVLIGPEGGFAAEERSKLLAAPNVVRIALGPRVLRADTAAVAALAVVQAALGDWR